MSSKLIVNGRFLLMEIDGEVKKLLEWHEDDRCTVSLTVLRSRIDKYRNGCRDRTIKKCVFDPPEKPGTRRSRKEMSSVLTLAEVASMAWR